MKHLELSVSIDFTSDTAYDIGGDTGILEGGFYDLTNSCETLDVLVLATPDPTRQVFKVFSCETWIS